MGISPGPPRSNLRSDSNLRWGGGRHNLDENELFEQIASCENLFSAWHLFCLGKRTRDDVMQFKRHLEDNLFEIQTQLATGRYRHSPYQPFTIYDPKQRTIHKALVKDRVVHQAIVNVIEPLLEKRFIYDSYSCRVGKGTHAAVKRLRTFLRQASHNNTKTLYAVKCDIRKFFASINHDILIVLLRKRIHDSQTMRLLEQIIRSFSITPGTGIPLGNLTSQLFANVYLHELDWYVKQKLHIQHYVRYCDDFVILRPSKSEGFALAETINGFLHQTLKLELHPQKIRVRTWTQGIDFLGYVLLPHATILRPTTARRMIERVDKENENSYLGLCLNNNTHKLRRLIKNKLG